MQYEMSRTTKLNIDPNDSPSVLNDSDDLRKTDCLVALELTELPKDQKTKDDEDETAKLIDPSDSPSTVKYSDDSEKYCLITVEPPELSKDEVCPTDLLESVLSNDCEKLRSLGALQPNSFNHLHHVYKKPLLLLACSGENEFENVNPEIIDILIDYGAKIDYFHKSWYCWEALHYAAKSCDPPRLKALVSKIGDRINSLTALSENALHIILSHGKYMETYDVSFEQSIAKIARDQPQEVVDCVEILIKAGIDVNHNNFWNETPILLAIKRKQFKVIEVLLKKENIDLDSCKDSISKKSARELLKSYKIDHDLKRSVDKGPADTGKILFQFLKSGDEDSFLKFSSGKLSIEAANSIDGDCPDNSSCTLLQYCFRRAFIQCRSESCSNEDSSWQSDIITNDLVQNFCQSGMVRVIEHLLDNGANIEFKLRKIEEPLIKAVSIKKFYPFLTLMFFNEKVNPSPDHIFEAIKELIGGKIDNFTLFILLTKLDELRNAKLSENKAANKINPLQLSNYKERREALKKSLKVGLRRISSENIKLLLKIFGFISSKQNKRAIVEELQAEVIESYLDDCIEKKNDSVYINYKSLMEDGNETNVIKILNSVPSLNRFLNHFIITDWIKKKWQTVHYVFNATLVFYIIFYILINMIVLFKYSETSGTVVDVTKTLTFIGFLVFTVKELFQLVTDFKFYVSEVSNYAELIFIILTAITFFAEKYYVDVVMVYLVLSANLVLLLLLEQVPMLTKYMIILQTVVYYLQYIIFYFILFVAFAICFYLLFSKPDERLVWYEVPVKLFETIIMFTGSLDYMETENFNNHEVSSRIVFIIFVLAMTVILHNLLLGLLMADMKEIKKDLKLYEQKRKVRFILRTEDFLKNSFVMKFMRWFPFFNKTNQSETNNNNLKLEQLDEDQNKYVTNVLARKNKAQNIPRKLYLYIRSNTRRGEEREPKEMSKEILGKIKVLEERIRDLSEIKETIKAEFAKINN